MKKTKKSEKNTKKSSNIVPFKQDLVLKDYPNPEQIKEKEINRVNEHFKKTFEDLEKFVDDAVYVQARRGIEFFFMPSKELYTQHLMLTLRLTMKQALMK